MGEYAKRLSDGREIKIGTCETMYYLRYEDRFKVQAIPHSLDPAKETGLFWRLPFPDEDEILPGDYEPFRPERLWTSGDVMADDLSFTDEPGIIQLHHEKTGLLLNVPCHHGRKLPECGQIQAFWNGKGPHLFLNSIKNCKDGSMRLVVECIGCGKLVSYEWGEIESYIHGELHDRLQTLCAPIVAHRG